MHVQTRAGFSSVRQRGKLWQEIWRSRLSTINERSPASLRSRLWSIAGTGKVVLQRPGSKRSTGGRCCGGRVSFRFLRCCLKAMWKQQSINQKRIVFRDKKMNECTRLKLQHNLKLKINKLTACAIFKNLPSSSDSDHYL